MIRIALLPGDGIGPEVAAAARRVLEALPLEVELEEHLFGGAAIHATGTPLPDETLDACRRADAVLLVTGTGLKTPQLAEASGSIIEIEPDIDALLEELGVPV